MNISCLRVGSENFQNKAGMFRYLIVAAVAGLVGVPVEGRTEVMSDMSVIAEQAAVIAAENDWIQAEINGDESALRRVIDDRFVFNSNDGTTAGKEELITNVLAWDMTGQTITERTVLVDGETAVIFGTTELRFASPDSEDVVSLLRYTSTYVKRDGQWRAIALHMERRAVAE